MTQSTQATSFEPDKGAADEPTVGTSPRARRTRAKLLAAARVVFERDGYLNARIADISVEAGTAIGSFYTYFKGKREIFVAVMDELQEEMLHPPHASAETDSLTLADSILDANRRYLEAYRVSAKLMAVLEEVAVTDPEFRDVRLRRGSAFTQRNARMIERLQQRGLADPELEPLLAARLLSGMVSRAAYQAFVLRQETDVDELARVLSLLWVNALGIPREQREDRA